MKSNEQRIFADTSGKKATSDAFRADEKRIAAKTRLVKNADFREWVSEVIETLYGVDCLVSDIGEFRRGQQSAASIIRLTLVEAEGSPEFFAELCRRHYDGMRRGVIETIKKNTKNEGIR